MIDWKKMVICDSCGMTTQRKHITTFNLEFEASHKHVCLCESCLKELKHVVDDALQESDDKVIENEDN